MPDLRAVCWLHLARQPSGTLQGHGTAMGGAVRLYAGMDHAQAATRIPLWAVRHYDRRCTARHSARLGRHHLFEYGIFQPYSTARPCPPYSRRTDGTQYRSGLRHHCDPAWHVGLDWRWIGSRVVRRSLRQSVGVVYRGVVVLHVYPRPAHVAAAPNSTVPVRAPGGSSLAAQPDRD